MADDCCGSAESKIILNEIVDLEALANQLKALAHPSRLQLLRIISANPAGETCVCDLAAPLKQGQPTISHHLKILAESGLVVREQRGRWAYFRPVPAAIAHVNSLLAQLSYADAAELEGSV